MSRVRAPANLSGMDRSLNADDYRLLAGLTAASGSHLPVATLGDLPDWFRRVVLEQAAWLGIALPEAALGCGRSSDAGQTRAA